MGWLGCIVVGSEAIGSVFIHLRECLGSLGCQICCRSPNHGSNADDRRDGRVIIRRLEVPNIFCPNLVTCERYARVMSCTGGSRLFHESMSYLAHRNGKVSARIGQHQYISRRVERGGLIPWAKMASAIHVQHDFRQGYRRTGVQAYYAVRPVPYWIWYSSKTGSGPRLSGTDGKQSL